MFVAGDILCCAQLATKGTLDVELLKIEQQWFGLDGYYFKNPSLQPVWHISNICVQIDPHCHCIVWSILLLKCKKTDSCWEAVVMERWYSVGAGQWRERYMNFEIISF